MEKIYKVISLFSGCGGMDLGFKGDFDVFGEHFKKNPYQIIYANDINESACETYKYNFKEEPYCGDIKSIDINQLPNADIVIGGFPCQDFSLAGKRRGLSADRGRLYLNMLDVVKKVKPIAFVAENVDGIRKNKENEEKSALDIIIKDFESAGYNVQYKALNAANYGVPQNRVRIIIVGIRNDLDLKMKYPNETFGNDIKPFRTAEEAIDDLWNMIDKTSISNHTSKDYSKAKFYPGKKLQGNNRIAANKPSPTIRAEHHGNIEGHYRSNNPNDINDVTGWRRLSVRECARLQSFPDDFIFTCSSSSAYKQVGNAVPPILAWNVANALYDTLNKKNIE